MDKSPELAAAFAVVKQCDPDLYRRMAATRWHVITEPDDMQSLMAAISDPAAFGATWHNGSKAVTLISPDNVRQFANDAGVPPEYFAATVLAHEYRHTQQRQPGSQAEADGEEPDAYAAGRAFAARLPAQYGQPIIAESDKDLGNYSH